MYTLDDNTVTIELASGPIILDRAKHDQMKKELVDAGLVKFTDANAVGVIHRRAQKAGYELRTNLQNSPAAALVPKATKYSTAGLETKLFHSILAAIRWLDKDTSK